MSAHHALLRRVLVALLLGVLGLAVGLVLLPFIVPLLWAAILGFVSFPLFARLSAIVGGRRNLAAALATMLMASAFVAPLFLLIAMLQGELGAALSAVKAFLHRGPHTLPEPIASLPVIGAWLQSLLDTASADPAAFSRMLAEWAGARGEEITRLVGGAGRNAAKFALSLIALFFIYRDGERLLMQVRHVLHRAIGARIDHYLQAIAATTRAVVYGLVLTALAQGTLAGLGYAVAGLKAPLLLGALTALLALLPFGAPLVWVPVGVWLVINGEMAAGAGLLAWGALVVSWVDNLIRPAVISNATDIPFLLVMFGVLGGLAAFGLIGVFIGPVVLAVAVAVWREWLAD